MESVFLFFFFLKASAKIQCLIKRLPLLRRSLGPHLQRRVARPPAWLVKGCICGSLSHLSFWDSTFLSSHSHTQIHARLAMTHVFYLVEESATMFSICTYLPTGTDGTISNGSQGSVMMLALQVFFNGVFRRASHRSGFEDITYKDVETSPVAVYVGCYSIFCYCYRKKCECVTMRRRL